MCNLILSVKKKSTILLLLYYNDLLCCVLLLTCVLTSTSEKRDLRHAHILLQNKPCFLESARPRKKKCCHQISADIYIIKKKVQYFVCRLFLRENEQLQKKKKQVIFKVSKKTKTKQKVLINSLVGC